MFMLLPLNHPATGYWLASIPAKNATSAIAPKLIILLLGIG